MSSNTNSSGLVYKVNGVSVNYLEYIRSLQSGYMQEVDSCTAGIQQTSGKTQDPRHYMDIQTNNDIETEDRASRPTACDDVHEYLDTVIKDMQSYYDKFINDMKLGLSIYEFEMDMMNIGSCNTMVEDDDTIDMAVPLSPPQPVFQQHKSRLLVTPLRLNSIHQPHQPVVIHHH